jgi:hypothetical protein
MMEAALGISVFIENTTSYDIAMEKFLARTAAYVYLTRLVLIVILKEQELTYCDIQRWRLAKCS